MPPISSPLFTEAQTTYEGISRILKDLNEYQIPRLRDCKGPLTLQQQFAAELRDDIDALAKRLEDFSTLAEDQERENERTQVKQWVTDLSNELARLKSESRNALLASKRAIDNDAKSRRDELLSTSLQEKRAADAEAHKQQATEDKLMAASDDVTEALRRTTRLMQQELERSVLSTQMLEESSKTLRATSDSYTSIDNLMDVSQVLIKALQRADWIDRIIIGLSLSVFLLTVAYIIKRRVLDRVVAVATLPVRLMVPSRASGSLTETLTNTAVSLPTTTLSSTSSLTTSTSSKILETLSDAVGSSTESALSVSQTLSSALCSGSVCPAKEGMYTTTSFLEEAASATASVISVVESMIHQEL